MKLLHLADLHIGKTLCGYSMLEDQKYVFSQIYEIIKQHHIDGVMLCGDIYDKSIPSVEAVSLFDSFLGEMKNLKVKVFIIPGNHDSKGRLSFCRGLLHESQVYIAENPEKITIEDDYGCVNIYMIPFDRPATMAAYVGEDSIKTYNDGVSAIIKHLNPDYTKRNVMMTHHFVVAGSQQPELSDSENLISVGGIEVVDASLFNQFDYVALGHIHKSQAMGKDYIRYAGSILKYSFSEALSEKTVPVIELKEKGKTNIELIPLKPLHDLRKIKGTLKALTEDDIVDKVDRKDYIHATLTDENVLFEPMKAMKAVYPNVMQLSFLRDNKKENAIETACTQMEHKSPMELFEEFYEEVMEMPLDQQKKKLMEDVINEAQATHS